MTGTLAAIIGLGTILAAVTLVWILSVRLRDASIADVCWGLGFVLLAWLYFDPVAGGDAAVLAGRHADHALGRASLRPHLSP